MSDKRFLAFGRTEKGSVTRHDVSADRVGASRDVPARGRADRAARGRGATVPPVEIRQA